MSPPARRVDSGVLKIPLASDLSWYVLHINLDELAGFADCPQVFVCDFFDTVLSYQTFRFEYLADRACMNVDPFFFKPPVELEGTESRLLSECDDALLEFDCGLFRVRLRGRVDLGSSAAVPPF